MSSNEGISPAQSISYPLTFFQPLFIYPNWFAGNPWGWTPVINAAAANPTIQYIALINVNSGPDVAINTDYVTGLSQLQANSNMIVLGYIGTKTATRSISDVKTDIDRWFTFYPSINGILLDEMSNVAGNEEYYRQLTSYAHQRSGCQYVFGNPGDPTLRSYTSTVDTIMVFEDVAPAPDEATLKTRTLNGSGLPPEKFGIIVHDSSVSPTASYLQTLSRYAQYVYFTDGTGVNPYAVCPSYLNAMLPLMSVTRTRQTANVPKSESSWNI